MDKPEVDPVFERAHNAILEIEACAVAHEKESNTPEPCIGNRCYLVAMLMFHLGLDVKDLGFIASDFMDLILDARESNAAEADMAMQDHQNTNIG